MRVTKIIKEYIEREVDKKYKEKLDSIPNDYKEDYDKMIDEIEDCVEKCNEYVKNIAIKYNMLEERDTNIVSYSSYHLRDYDRLQKRRELENELKKEKENKIAQIILDLELGETTKKELQNVLSKIEF